MSKEQNKCCGKCVKYNEGYPCWNTLCKCHKETKLLECNCQYEEGHSFECPLYKPTPNPLETKLPKERCEFCSGKGWTLDKWAKCPKCSGSGLSPQKEEPKCVCGCQDRNKVFSKDKIWDKNCIYFHQKEEPKESFEERTAKKLDNDILDKICEEPKEWEVEFEVLFEELDEQFFPTGKNKLKTFISKVESKAKQETIAKVREMIEEECEKICGKEQKYRSNGCMHLTTLQILDKLKGI